MTLFTLTSPSPSLGLFPWPQWPTQPLHSLNSVGTFYSHCCTLFLCMALKCWHCPGFFLVACSSCLDPLLHGFS
jgi:hypothetical protein